MRLNGGGRSTGRSARACGRVFREPKIELLDRVITAAITRDWDGSGADWTFESPFRDDSLFSEYSALRWAEKAGTSRRVDAFVWSLLGEIGVGR